MTRTTIIDGAGTSGLYELLFRLLYTEDDMNKKQEHAASEQTQASFAEPIIE